MNRLNSFGILLPLCLCWMAQYPLSAQGISSSTAGFSVKGGPILETWATSSYYLGDVDGVSFFGGYLGVAYGFNQRIACFTSYRYAGGFTQRDYKTYRSQTYTIGVRTHFGGTLHRLRPWLSAAFSWQTLLLNPISYYDDVGTYLGEFSLGARGPAVEAGIGAQYFLTPALALDLGVFGRFGGFSTIRIDGRIDDPEESVDFRFFGLSLGLSYYLY